MKKSTLLWLATLSCYATFAQTKTIKVLDIEKNSAPITVDGVLNESVWSNLQPITNQINIAKNDCGEVLPGTGNNNTASFDAVWNDDVLTIGIQVKDLSLGGGDGIDLYLSMDNNRTTNCPNNWPRAYNASTFLIEIDPIKGTATSPNGQAGNVGELKVSLIPGGYTAEITLLWSEMDFLSGLRTAVGREIGFDLGINDNDGQGNSRTGQLMWNNSCADRNWTEATNFGILKLGTDICQRPNIAGVAKCGATAVTLTPQGGTEYFWYKNSNDATPFFKGNSYTTPVLNASTTYYVANNSSRCLSDKVPVKVSIDLKAPEAINSNISGTINPCAGYNEFTYYTQNFESEAYSWRSTGNIVTTYSNSATITWPFAGAGKVTVFKTNSCGKGPDKSLEVFVQSTPNPKFTISGPTTICPGSISTYEIVGDKDNNYIWNFNNGWYNNTQILSQTNTKATVKWEAQGLNNVTVNAYNNCGNSPAVVLAVNVISKPFTPSICKLTADKTGAMIEVVGNKYYQNYYYPTFDSLPFKFIDSMLVYREGRKANQYSLIGGVSVKKGYNFTDITARPSQQEYRYKISLKDSCGNVSDLSELNKTIYLAMNRGFADNIWNLVWTPYIGLYEIPTYDIYRGTSADKMEFLNSVSGNSTSFTDFDAPKGTNLYYQIRIADINCGNSSDNEIRSNLINYNIITGMVGNEIVDAGFNVYPNPNAGNFTIESTNASGNISIYNVLGEEVRTGQVDLNNSKLEVNGLSAGIYSLEITKSGVKSRTTIVVQ